jgi:GT2 family glycosyltransferase
MSVTIGIVTWNSAEVIERCLASVRQQTCPGITLRIADNASQDGTRAVLERLTAPDERRWFARNLGFSAAHNRLIAASATSYYLALNPDIQLSPDFVLRLVSALEADPSAGAATGKLLRFPSGDGPDVDVIDTTGIIMLPSQRHLDRGADTADDGRFERQEYVFGASGAAAIYRRAMLDDVGLDDVALSDVALEDEGRDDVALRAGAGRGREWFDEDFFAYREDADLAWRAQLYGWNCLYVPAAVGRHGRRVTPERRASLPAHINYYSVRNRFLLRLKNQTAGHALRFLPATLLRDLQVLGFVLLRERASWPAIGDILRLWPRTWRKRRTIMTSRRRSTRDMIRWFVEESRPQGARLDAAPVAVASAAGNEDGHEE